MPRSDASGVAPKRGGFQFPPGSAAFRRDIHHRRLVGSARALQGRNPVAGQGGPGLTPTGREATGPRASPSRRYTTQADADAGGREATRPSMTRPSIKSSLPLLHQGIRTWAFPCPAKEYRRIAATGFNPSDSPARGGMEVIYTPLLLKARVLKNSESLGEKTWDLP